MVAAEHLQNCGSARRGGGTGSAGAISSKESASLNQTVEANQVQENADDVSGRPWSAGSAAQKRARGCVSRRHGHIKRCCFNESQFPVYVDCAIVNADANANRRAAAGIEDYDCSYGCDLCHPYLLSWQFVRRGIDVASPVNNCAPSEALNAPMLPRTGRIDARTCIPMNGD
jgi:hypothetical protein